MSKLVELLAASAAHHDHLCPRQVLGVRIGILAGSLLKLDLPQRDKRLLAFIETDGCFADGISAATGCTVGHRTLRVYDFGKVAATFADTQSGNSFRIAPRPDVRERASQYSPKAQSRWHAQLESYQIMPDEIMFTIEPVVLNFSLEQLVSMHGLNTVCEQCGDEIINGREIIRNGLTLCRTCAGESYYAGLSQSALTRR